jgi:hypothetical protein
MPPLPPAPIRRARAFILGKDFWLSRSLVVVGQEGGETLTAGKRPNTHKQHKQSTPTPKDKRCVSTLYPMTPTAVKQQKKKSKGKPLTTKDKEKKGKEDWH